MTARTGQDCSDSCSNRKLRDFIQTYPLVIEDVQGLLGQPKAASIHASAIVVTPDTRDGRPAECFDFLPVRKMDGALVSEFDGYSVDEIGLLKEDVLATKELAKLSAVIALVNRNFGQELTIGRITQDMLEDGKTYRLLSDGNTQNVFQFSFAGHYPVYPGCTAGVYRGPDRHQCPVPSRHTRHRCHR